MLTIFSSQKVFEQELNNYFALDAKVGDQAAQRRVNESKVLGFFVCFGGATPAVYEVPRLRVEWELQLPAYATATAVPDLSHICDLRHCL